MVKYIIETRWDDKEHEIWDGTVFLYFDLKPALAKLEELRSEKGHDKYRLLKVTRTEEVVA
jgi:hypothetical protein